MTSRERLLNALDRKPTDRVPISTYELVGWNTQAFENQEPSYQALMDAIRDRTDCIAMWNPASNERFLCSSTRSKSTHGGAAKDDVTTIHNTMHTPKGDLTQTLQIFDDVKTVWQVEHWCKSPEDVDKALSVPYEPAKHSAEDYERICREVGDRGIVMASTGDALIYAAELMEMGEFTVWAMTETEHFARTVAEFHERNQQGVESMLKAAPVDLYRICGPEYATPPYLPPSFFERFVQPYVKEQIDLVHRFEPKGQSALPRQNRAHPRHDQSNRARRARSVRGASGRGVELAEVKARVGRRMCLFGNIQLKVLEAGTGEQVRAEVRKCMDSAKARGGYVIMPTAAPINIPLSSKTLDNYMAYIEACEALGGY